MTGRVENTGSSSTEVTLPLAVNGRTITTHSFTLGAGEQREITLTGSPTTTGTQPITVAGTHVGEVVVRAERPDIVRDVGAHYYPWYGAPLHDYRGGEWSLESPSTPVLGNYDSTNPDVIEQHIDWCRQAGISWLNVSWWGRNSGHDRRFREDILGHPRSDELDWSVLYETVGQFGVDPIDLSDETNQRQLVNDFEYLGEHYFDRDSYKRIDGRPVLYIWVARLFHGDVAAAYEAAVEAAGVRPYLIASVPAASGLGTHPILEVADAVTTYNPYTVSGRTADEFIDDLQSGYEKWYRSSEYVGVDVIPTAMPGFDDTELTHDQRDNVPLEPSAERYERSADVARHYADGPVLVTSFNEWYEDTAIEPSEDHGEAYLDVTAEALAAAERSPPTIDGETFVLSFGKLIAESEMNPDIENGRQFSFMLDELTIRDDDGQARIDLDVGTGSETVEFLLGSYGPESTEENTWRWLGGQRDTAIDVPSLPDAGEIEISGLAPAEMDVALKVDGDVHDKTTLAEGSGSYRLELG
ncbi:glycoside hydrolase family 99-like domain-containing protein [Halolamina litorea]|uniref:glycoside hydrolase family 99-like domain-containing protein n=1 Tax=Halolamina litorea TaxID=1515593 RepID=UPI00226F8CBB|nr:glycoside hydrolase family 99-like domain-containing protein [Halolamina litorea]